MSSSLLLGQRRRLALSCSVQKPGRIETRFKPRPGRVKQRCSSQTRVWWWRDEGDLHCNSDQARESSSRKQVGEKVNEDMK